MPGNILNTPIRELIFVCTLNFVAWFSRNSSSHSTTWRVQPNKIKKQRKLWAQFNKGCCRKGGGEWGQGSELTFRCKAQENKPPSLPPAKYNQPYLQYLLPQWPMEDSLENQKHQTFEHLPSMHGFLCKVYHGRITSPNKWNKWWKSCFRLPCTN